MKPQDMIEKLLNNKNLVKIIVWLSLLILLLFLLLPKSIIANNIIVLLAYNKINHHYFYLYVFIISGIISYIITNTIFKLYKIINS